ncbi:MAG: tryptophan synthase subunit beta [Parvimonas sp.]|nr:tryptophan synthase subunit beta [Parvimonas sp.]
MNILFLIGNGLDLQYKMKTSYKNFYDDQRVIYEERKSNVTDKRPYSNYIYKSLYDEQDKNAVNEKSNWLDLELYIGELSKKYWKTNPKDGWDKFVEDFEEVEYDLNLYLQKQESDYVTDGKQINFKKTLDNLLVDLEEAYSSRLHSYVKGFVPSSDRVRILTFNYTMVLDKILDNSPKKYDGSFTSEAYSTTIDKVCHAHGLLNNNPVLGVSDETQISDLMGEEISKFFVKGKIIEYCKNNNNQRNEAMINEADLIIIFGMSLGETDSYIWEKVATKSIYSNIPIVIYHYKDNFERRIPATTIREYIKVENKFIKNSRVKDENIDKLRNNILVAINKAIFEIEEKK